MTHAAASPPRARSARPPGTYHRLADSLSCPVPSARAQLGGKVRGGDLAEPQNAPEPPTVAFGEKTETGARLAEEAKRTQM